MLDRNEYNYHKKIMGYKPELDKILKQELSNLIELARLRKWPFDDKQIDYYYQSFKEIKKSQKSEKKLEA